MKSLRLIVSGRVQKVGYRSLVDEIAFALGVRGQVKNLENKTVEIIAEHEDEGVLENFIEKIKINEYPIRVSHVTKEEINSINYKEFEVVEGALEIENRESLEAGAVYMRRLASEQKMMREELGGKIDSGFSNMGEKIDSGFSNMGEKIDSGFSGMGKKIDSGFSGMGNKIDSGFSGNGKKIESLTKATTERFDTVDTKYGKISDRLEKINTSLERLIEILEVFKPK